VIIKVIGTKNKILFVESVDNKDAKLYQLLYPEFKVWPVGSCDNVINYTKAFNLGVEKFNKKYLVWWMQIFEARKRFKNL